ncbi:hypothetical protein [Synechococcus sp. UW140]|uniref:hypothetical protein n=1 Tax=Synechococcus sp. UW140 TaxID=368503 RepID=UPI0025DFB023|nr:hypothetical protein [Synechococcus sp. UW140]
MPSNIQMEGCIRAERGALLFCSPKERQRGLTSKVQIIDVFALQVVTGYCRDPQGRLLLESQPSLAAGRNWSIAKATQLIRNDARPKRWVALQVDKYAWGLFWAGGGLQRCRELLEKDAITIDNQSALVPASPEALLRLVLDLQTGAKNEEDNSIPIPIRTARYQKNNQLKVIAYTSIVWLCVLLVTVAGFMYILDRQDQKLEILLERTKPY